MGVGAALKLLKTLFVLCLLAGTQFAHGAIVFVQKLPTQILTGTLPVQSGAFSANPTLGNTIICTISAFNSSTATYTISDTAGNTIPSTPDVTIERSAFGTDFERASIFSYPVTVTGASFKVTFTLATGSTPELLAQCSEFSGVATSSPLETSNTGVNGSATTSLTVAATSTTSGDLLIAAFAAESDHTSNSVSDPPTVNASATGVNSIAVSQDFDTIEGGEHAYKILGAGASQSVNWTYLTSSIVSAQYVAAVGLYKPAVAATTQSKLFLLGVGP